ncbi:MULTISPECIES: hypothetical protein [Bradyrhizobium]|uniref:hypothetical protein n=1 Tax=Bradyrhizobium elkanii TaxID=29448 RepID=UPI000419124D|nr:hypothetical protein [Bradyrhizobium elkanii]
MPRKLKTYQTSLGFYDQAIAAPSMKAALEAWGADSNLFHQGVAKETDDPEIVAATMAKPGVVLRRPVGSNGPFNEHAELPTDLADGGAAAGRTRRRAKPKKPAPSKISDKQALFPSELLERSSKRSAPLARSCPILLSFFASSLAVASRKPLAARSPAVDDFRS